METQEIQVSSMTFAYCVEKVRARLLLDPEIEFPEVRLQQLQTKMSAKHEIAKDKLRAWLKLITRYRVFAGNNGGSGDSSKSLSTQHPVTPTNSGFRCFIFSKVGSSFSLSTSEIPSRTRDAKTFAFSGPRCSKALSSSNAIVVTHLHCHAISQNLISHFQTP